MVVQLNDNVMARAKTSAFAGCAKVAGPVFQCARLALFLRLLQGWGVVTRAWFGNDWRCASLFLGRELL